MKEKLPHLVTKLGGIIGVSVNKPWRVMAKAFNPSTLEAKKRSLLVGGPASFTNPSSRIAKVTQRNPVKKTNQTNQPTNQPTKNQVGTQVSVNSIPKHGYPRQGQADLVSGADRF